MFGRLFKGKQAEASPAEKAKSDKAGSSTNGHGDGGSKKRDSKRNSSRDQRADGNRDRNQNRRQGARDSSERGDANSGQGGRRRRSRNRGRREQRDEQTTADAASSASGELNQQGQKSRQGRKERPDAAKPSRQNVSRPEKAAANGGWDLSQFDVPPAPGKRRFHDFGLPIEIMHAIADLGFQYCSPIQAQALPYALNGEDVVGKAQTGTGKTAAFLVAIIDDLLKHPIDEPRYAGEARALILAPTRELVLQIAADAEALCKYTDLEIHALVGGMDYGKQQRNLQERLVDILVATPGRLLDFCGNRDVHLDQVEVLVIDEADRMLDMGFIPQIRRIVRQTPDKSHRQTLMFSATFTDDVTRLVDQWTDRHVKVEIEPESVATDTVTQHIYLVAAEEKYTMLYNILRQAEVESLIVFSNRRDECRHLYDKLKAHGFPVGLLSGEIAQNQRVRTLDAFKSGELKVLVATDVAGRGIHIEGVSHVVNLTLPDEPEDYVHRIGRTGRAGKRGTSISFACEDDAFRLEPIQTLLGQPLRCEQPPPDLLQSAPDIDLPARRSNRRPPRPRRRS